MKFNTVRSIKVPNYISEQLKRTLVLTFGSYRSSRNTNICLSVCVCGSKLSIALNFHYSGSDL